MGYLKFDKTKLVNLEYSLKREMLSTNRTGGYLSTTIVCCNTRKYHGLLVAPIEEFDGDNHVILSTLDETIIQQKESFNLAIHRYPGIYEPRGHKYITNFEYEPTPTIIYQVGNIVLKKELLMLHYDDQLLVRYTLLDAQSSIKLQLKPFLAFRQIHKLSKANMNVNTKYNVIANGISTKLYLGFPTLFMQLDKKNEFVPAPDWYYNIEYLEEQRRGYDFREDLFVSGYFEASMKKGDSIIFSASFKETSTVGLKKRFNNELEKRPSKNSFIDCLKNSAAQFIVKQGKATEVVAGYPWFGRWGRDTFIALPGLTLSAFGDTKTCKDVLNTMSSELKNGLFPNIGKSTNAAYNSVDAPLWYFWAIQQFDYFTNDSAEVWKLYGKKMKAILKSYREGVGYNIRMHDNGLIWAEEKGKALTWMDAIAYGKPVTPRAGYAVDINALWYNAVCYTLELARKFKDTVFVKGWKDIPALIERSFLPTFWCEERQHLADYVDEEGQNIFTRPNQIFAASLPYTAITDEVKYKIMSVVERELLTPKGIRTLSPKNPSYIGRYEGDQPTRDSVYHQGTAWPWLLGYYVEANFKLYGEAFVNLAEQIINNFGEDMTYYGIGSVSEVYDGDPPQEPGGCISQAWSVAELLRIVRMIEHYKKPK
ncbi:MAG: amylo-alpha-1,6-glucosidase [Prevotellaceae bacterium]|jgi:predicted glycogen debranching enzyme|nr:amylo-alpha-1,6-glucosidase [Prevotellaceae bacterium]